MNLAKILVPLDGSVLAETAVPTAVGLAKERGATVALLRAVEAPWLMREDPVKAEVHVVRQAEAYLEDITARLRAGGGPAIETSVWYGDAATSIVEAAKVLRVDLIVMTSHGRSGIGRLILGSVAETVLRSTTTPILLLRATGAALLPTEAKARPVETALASS